MKKIALITGASSGIGLDAVTLFANAGFRVYGAARNIDSIQKLNHPDVVAIRMDLTDNDSVDNAVAKILQTEGRIDILVNNAGYGSFGPIEEVSIAEAERQMQVNVMGAMRISKAVIPAMRAQGSGRIINTSSIAGRISIIFGGWYNASKYALEAVSNALRMELKPFGIDVVLIEPGGIKTNWGLIAAEHLKQTTAGTPYERRADKMAKIMIKGYSGNWLSNPKVVAKTMLRAATARRPRARYLCGRASSLLINLNRLLPTRLFDALTSGLITR